MTPDQFRQWTRVLSETALLVASDGRILAVSRGATAFGLDPARLEGQGLSKVACSSGDEAARFLKLCSRVREPVMGAISLPRKEGGAVDCACRGMLVGPVQAGRERTVLITLTPKGEAIRRYTLLEEKIEELNRQIHRRMELELELRKRNEYLQVTLASIGDGVVVTDAQARVTLLNRVAESLTGWSSSDAQGQPLETVFRIVNETSRLPVENPVLQAVRDGVVVGLANHTVLIAKDGTERPIDDSAAAILDPHGAVLGAALVFRDVTDRRKADTRLKEQISLFSQLADAIPQLAWRTRPDGYVEWYNGRWYEYTGSTPEEMEGWGWQSVIDPEALPELTKRWKASLASGQPLSIVFKIRGADGEYRPFLTRVMPFRDESGAIVRWFGTNTDISEQKQLEGELRLLADRLADSNRRKDEFLAMLAHELRNPLAPIRTGLELLRLVGDDPEQRESTRAMMERQTQQLITLVDDLLDVSRITRGKLELRKRRIELASVIRSAIEASRPFIDEAGHAFDVRLPEKAVAVEGDPHRLAQVFANLLNNAAKYTAAGGRIGLRAEERNGEVVVEVADSGVGIPRDKLNEIFDMFTQIDYPQEMGYTGLGIGLTLVRTLVELHGGRVEVESDGQGTGSLFRVTLPVTKVVGPDQSAEGAAQATAPSRRRVLVVDDNEAAAKMLSLLLKLSGHEVRTAHDGIEALEVGSVFEPEVALMDLGMPRLNGYEAARRLRKEPWGQRVVLIALTGWGQDEDRRRTRELGFDHHLVKPVDPEKLTRLLDEQSSRSAGVRSP